MRSIVSGLVLIALGFVFGNSVFMGDFSIMSIFFDGLGIVLIIKGALEMKKAKDTSTG